MYSSSIISPKTDIKIDTFGTNINLPIMYGNMFLVIDGIMQGYDTPNEWTKNSICHLFMFSTVTFVRTLNV